MQNIFPIEKQQSRSYEMVEGKSDLMRSSYMNSPMKSIKSISKSKRSHDMHEQGKSMFFQNKFQNGNNRSSSSSSDQEQSNSPTPEMKPRASQKKSKFFDRPPIIRNSPPTNIRNSRSFVANSPTHSQKLPSQNNVRINKKLLAVQPAGQITSINQLKDNEFEVAFQKDLSGQSDYGSKSRQSQRSSDLDEFKLDKEEKVYGFDPNQQEQNRIQGEQMEMGMGMIRLIRVISNQLESGIEPQKIQQSTPQFQELATNEQFLRSKSLRKNINQKLWIIMPETKLKQAWNAVIILVLIYSAIFFPFKVAYIDDNEYPVWDYFDYSIDAIFFIDIVINFFSAYYDDENNLVTENNQIMIHYISGWFLIDLVATFPIYLFQTSSSTKYKGLARISRLPRLYRLMKMTKLVRMMQLLNQNTLPICCSDTIGVKNGVERFCISILLLILSCHIISCIWYLQATLQDGETWVTPYLEKSQYDQYIASLYWTIQTVLTVGYGDIVAKSWPERLFSLLWMLLSVYLYSFAIGSLTSLLEQMDHQNQNYLRRLNILKNIKKEYPNVNQFLFNKIKRELKRGSTFQEESQNYNSILQELPTNLRIELAVIIHKELIQQIPFFQDKPSGFIAYTAPLLKTLKVHKHEYIYMSGDPAEEIYFIKSGKVAAVIPQYKNFKFLLVKAGAFFGEVDILFYGEKRKYTFQTAKDCELYVLSKRHFKQIFFVEFREMGLEMVQSAQERKKKMQQIHKDALKFCRTNYTSNEEQEEESPEQKQQQQSGQGTRSQFKRRNQKFFTQKIKNQKSLSSQNHKNKSKTHYKSESEEKQWKSKPKIEIYTAGIDNEDDSYCSPQKTNKLLEIVDFLGEDRNQEKETNRKQKSEQDNRQNDIALKQYYFRINELELELREKDEIIENLGKQITEILYNIQNKEEQPQLLDVNVEDALDNKSTLDSYKKKIENQLQLRRTLRAQKHMTQTLRIMEKRSRYSTEQNIK